MMCQNKREFDTMRGALETSSPATLALEKASGSIRKTMMRSSPSLKSASSWTATDSLHSMFLMRHEEDDFDFGSATSAADEDNEEEFGFPSIEWDDSAATGSYSNSCGAPLQALSSALAILNEDTAIRRSNPVKRRRIGASRGEHHGMVRSKAMQSKLASLAGTAISCAMESNVSVNNHTNNSMAQFMIGSRECLVVAREVTGRMATCSLKNSRFDTSAVGGLLAVHAVHV